MHQEIYQQESKKKEMKGQIIKESKSWKIREAGELENLSVVV